MKIDCFMSSNEQLDLSLSILSFYVSGKQGIWPVFMCDCYLEIMDEQTEM